MVPGNAQAPHPCLSVSQFSKFTCRRFNGAKVIWLNDRVLRSRSDLGATVDDDGNLRWPVANSFMVGVPDKDDPPEVFIGHECFLYAERYGDTVGSIHGGGGRVGVSGKFNAKGIGRTPLVSSAGDWYHSHGCLWFEEAVREAIFSEIIGQIFPFGAVPVLAIIDTGHPIYWWDGVPGGRRFIIVRENCLRLAGLQRSIFFGTSGYEGADQMVDALRVQDLWNAFAVTDGDPRGYAEEALSRVLFRVGAQYGFGDCTRIWPGPLTTQNVALDGKLVDFGNARIVPDWQKCRGKDEEHQFGSYERQVDAIVGSLSRLGERHGHAIASGSLAQSFRDGHGYGFHQALNNLGVPARGGFLPRLKSLIAAQQAAMTTSASSLSPAHQLSDLNLLLGFPSTSRSQFLNGDPAGDTLVRSECGLEGLISRCFMQGTDLTREALIDDANQLLRERLESGDLSEGLYDLIRAKTIPCLQRFGLGQGLTVAARHCQDRPVPYRTESVDEHRSPSALLGLSV